MGIDPARIERNRSLRPFSTLAAGGTAERFVVARSIDELEHASQIAESGGFFPTVLGLGSNVLPSDGGVPGLVVINAARSIQVAPNGEVLAECGASFQELFLKTAQQGFHGFEYAVGIPGTVGGALVSNAGAYRSAISEFLVGIEVVHEGRRCWVDPSFMRFSYRDSRLRGHGAERLVMLQAKFQLSRADRKAIYDEARDYQRQRIGKQPGPASAGSFFKNVESHELAASLPTLPPPLKAAGVVPSGFLIEYCGLRGYRHGGAMFAERHANFIVNIASASATEIRELADLARHRVHREFGVMLEEEVLYLGDWSGYSAG